MIYGGEDFFRIRIGGSREYDGAYHMDLIVRSPHSKVASNSSFGCSSIDGEGGTDCYQLYEKECSTSSSDRLLPVEKSLRYTHLYRYCVIENTQPESLA